MRVSFFTWRQNSSRGIPYSGMVLANATNITKYSSKARYFRIQMNLSAFVEKQYAPVVCNIFLALFLES